MLSRKKDEMSEKDTDGTGEPSDGQMAAKIILLVSDSNDSKFGEIIVLDEVRKVESAIEALLEAGFEQERVHVFTGAEINIQVTYRPLVVLAGDLADSAEESDHRLDGQADPEIDEVGAGGWQPGRVESLNGNGRRRSGVHISSLLFWKRARRPSG
jgi:hypothetical protein